MKLTTERQQFAEQNEMSMEFVNWFFDEKKESFGNMWFLMAAAMWEAWKGRDSREAQPVVEPYMYELWKFDETIPELERWFLVERSHSKLVASKGQKVVLLYTAPPAPAVPDDVRQALREMDDEILAELDAEENACRAAMLAQPVSSGYKLPPHLYRELVNSLRDTAVKFSGTEQLRERLNTALSQFIEPDHPHTRTVAPEGGNDHDTRR